MSGCVLGYWDIEMNVIVPSQLWGRSRFRRVVRKQREDEKRCVLGEIAHFPE